MTRPDPVPPAPPPPARLHIDAPDEWHRLSPWMMAVGLVEALPSLIPVLIAVVFAGRSAPLLILIATVLIVPPAAAIPWLTTFYQVTDEHVRVRSGLLNKKVATARRDRIRSVDLTASPVHRILNLQKVTIGTGGDDQSSQVKLRAVTLAEARALHDKLMPTATSGAAARRGCHGRLAGTPGRAPRGADAVPDELAALLAVLGRRPRGRGGDRRRRRTDRQRGRIVRPDRGVVHDAYDTVRDMPLALVATVGMVAVIVVGAVLSAVGYLLSYWDFRLTRHPDGTCAPSADSSPPMPSASTRTGFAIELSEPILMRPLRGARLHAIAIGAHKHPLLLPPAPRDEAIRVAGLVTRAGRTDRPLTSTGRAAFVRRLNRGSSPASSCSRRSLSRPSPAPFPSARSRRVHSRFRVDDSRRRPRRHLGHRVTARSVVIAPPTVARRRIVVDRDGVVGWASRSSLFQRRAGCAR